MIGLNGYYHTPRKTNKLYFPFCIKNRWGMKTDDNEVILSPTYDYIDSFYSEHGFGIALVRKDKLYGFINIKGEVIVPIQFEYDEITRGVYEIDPEKKISSKIVALKMKKEYIYIDSKGEKISNLLFDKGSEYSFMNNGVVKYQNRFGILSKNGTFLIKPIYDSITYYDNENIIVKKDNQCLLINIQGDIKIDSLYENIQFIGDDKYIIKLNNTFGVVDSKNNIVFYPIYKEIIYRFWEKNDLTLIDKDGVTFYYSIQTKQLVKIDKKYHNIYKFSDGYRVEKKDTQNNNIGFLDLKRDVVLAPKYNSIEVNNGIIIATKLDDSSSYIYKTNGSFIMKLDVDYISNLHKGILLVHKDKKEGFINLEDSRNYLHMRDKISILSTTMINVKVEERWGVVDYDGNYLLEPIYDVKIVRLNNYYLVSKNKKLAIFDHEFNQKCDFIFDRYCRTFENNYIFLIVNGYFGLYDYTKLKFIIPAQYDNITYEIGDYYTCIKDETSTLIKI